MCVTWDRTDPPESGRHSRRNRAPRTTSRCQWLGDEASPILPRLQQFGEMCPRIGLRVIQLRRLVRRGSLLSVTRRQNPPVSQCHEPVFASLNLHRGDRHPAAKATTTCHESLVIARFLCGGRAAE